MPYKNIEIRKKYEREYRKNNRNKNIEYQKKYRGLNKEKLLKQKKEYYQNNKDKINEYSKIYNKNNKDKILENKKNYYKDNREKVIENVETYRKNNKEKVLECRKNYNKNNIDKVLEKSKKYYIKNKNKIIKYQINYEKERTKKDLKYNLTRKMKCLMYSVIKKNKSGRKWEELTGYSVGDLTKRLKSTMPEGYSWEDFMEGKLHIDHIIPKSIFNYTKPGHIGFKRCWSLENLQLLPAEENMKKHNKINSLFQQKLIEAFGMTIDGRKKKTITDRRREK